MRPAVLTSVLLTPVLVTITALSLGLGGCSSPDEITQAQPDVPPAERIACAQGDVPLTDDCTIERAADGIVIVRHPDGAFRRFNPDGTAADGAQTALVTSVEGGREVTVAGDRYRFPGPPR